MNEVPVGSKMKVKSSGKIVELIEIQNFPTTFKAQDKDGNIKNYFTYEVEIENWPPNE